MSEKEAGDKSLKAQIAKKIDNLRIKAKVASLSARENREVNDAIALGMADERAVKMMEKNPEVLAIIDDESRLFEIYGEHIPEDEAQKLIARKRALSNAQLFALTNLYTQRLIELGKQITSKK